MRIVGQVCICEANSGGSRGGGVELLERFGLLKVLLESWLVMMTGTVDGVIASDRDV